MASPLDITISDGVTAVVYDPASEPPVCVTSTWGYMTLSVDEATELRDALNRVIEEARK